MAVNTKAATTQAELDRINQNTPQGSSTYNITGTNPDGTPQYTQNTTYSPAEQQKYDLNNQVATSLDQLANQNVSRVQQTQATPFNYDGIQPQVSSVTPGALATGPTGANPVQTTIAQGPIQNSVDYSNLTALPGTGDFSADASRVANSVYNQAASRLNPQWQQNDANLTSKLAAQGIDANSQAGQRAALNESNAKNDAYNQANYSAQQAGATEQSRIFGLALQARQQGQNEADTSGTFANAAQNQGFTQASQIADLFNQAQQQQFAQGTSAAAFQNTNQATQFQQGGANAALANQARQEGISEATYLRNLPLNEVASLLGTGSPVQNPTFSSTPQVGVAAPDYSGIVQNNYNQAVSQYNTQQQAQAQMLGSIFGAAGTIGSAFIPKPSDVRLKYDIRQIGELVNGIKTYAFKYIGETIQRFGVMAQDVLGIRPEAVSFTSDGYMAVSYGRIW
jgi:hypothetical protein